MRSRVEMRVEGGADHMMCSLDGCSETAGNYCDKSSYFPYYQQIDLHFDLIGLYFHLVEIHLILTEDELEAFPLYCRCDWYLRVNGFHQFLHHLGFLRQRSFGAENDQTCDHLADDGDEVPESEGVCESPRSFAEKSCSCSCCLKMSSCIEKDQSSECGGFESEAHGRYSLHDNFSLPFSRVDHHDDDFVQHESQNDHYCAQERKQDLDLGYVLGHQKNCCREVAFVCLIAWALRHLLL